MIKKIIKWCQISVIITGFMFMVGMFGKELKKDIDRQKERERLNRKTAEAYYLDMFIKYEGFRVWVSNSDPTFYFETLSNMDKQD